MVHLNQVLFSLPIHYNRPCGNLMYEQLIEIGEFVPGKMFFLNLAQNQILTSFIKMYLLYEKA